MKRKLFLGAVFFTIGTLSIPVCAGSESETVAVSDTAKTADETDAALSAEEILDGMNAYTADADSLSAALDLNLSAAFTIDAEDAPEESMNLKLSGSFDLREILDPMTTALEGSFQMSLAGETIEVSLEQYTTISDDKETLDQYLCFSSEGISGEWIHTRSDLSETLSAYGASSLEELESMDLTDLLGESATLDWTIADQGSSWMLTAQVDAAQLLPLIQSSLEQEDSTKDISEEIWQVAEEALGAIPVNLSYGIEKDTLAPKTTHVDFNDADLEAINQTISSLFGDAEEETETSSSADATISETETSAETANQEETESESETDDSFRLTLDSLSDFSIDAAYNYDEIDEILIPAEALLTAVTE